MANNERVCSQVTAIFSGSKNSLSLLGAYKMTELWQRSAALITLIVMALFTPMSFAQSNSILFKNVRIFDGKSDSLSASSSVLVEGNKITRISTRDISAGGAIVIDGEGRTLMPGLIEGHGHLMMNGSSLADIENNRNWEELASRAAAKADMALMSGFTSWRDMGGMGSGLKKTIDAGLLKGPRIYPSGAFIGPTGSHADFRNFTTPNETVYGANSAGSRMGMTFTADGVDMIKTGARQNFMQGATQIKIMSSGGVASAFDPWQLDAYSAEEIQAAVEVADAYGSYVGSHAYSKTSIMRCLENGVKTIEHGFSFDGDIAAMMKEKGAYMTTNTHAFSPELGKIEAISSSPASARKAKSATAAFADWVDNVKKYRPKFGFQADCVGGIESCKKQTDHEIWLSANLLGNHYTLKSLTSVNGEILALTGDTLNPYPDGKLGVIEEGAYADILLVDGNPLEDITAIGGSEQWFDAPARDGIDSMRIIVKDGVIYKNTL
jgi:imidazolonepropionase-like amidohydrolase